MQNPQKASNEATKDQNDKNVANKNDASATKDQNGANKNEKDSSAKKEEISNKK